MRYITMLILFISTLFAGEIDEVVAAIKENWKTVSTGKATGLISPNGAWIATSQGGFWEFQSPEENKAMIENSPNTLNLKPHHINVEILGSEKNIAYAVYYLAGNIDRDGIVIVPNYRTRASSLMKKESGQWYQIGAHFSAMHSGSGVKLD